MVANYLLTLRAQVAAATIGLDVGFAGLGVDTFLGQSEHPSTGLSSFSAVS